MDIKYEQPRDYTLNMPIHMGIYGYNGVGKTTLAGSSGLRTVLLDCGDAGAVTLRKITEGLEIVRIHSILHYLDVVADVIRRDNVDLLVPDTITGLQSLAIREVKGKRTFDMNQRKWGLVSSKVIECLAETRNFPRDVVYLIQERRKGSDDSEDEICPNLTPSIRSYLSSIVDWVGYLALDDEGNRTLDFRITNTLEAKDRANLFPKRIKKPSYLPIRKRIITEMSGEQNGQSS